VEGDVDDRVGADTCDPEFIVSFVHDLVERHDKLLKALQSVK